MENALSNQGQAHTMSGAAPPGWSAIFDRVFALGRVVLACSLSLGLASCGGDDGGGERATGRTETGVVQSERRTATEPSARSAQSGRLRLRKVGSFNDPLYVTAPPKDRSRLFVVEQGGKIRIVRKGRKLGRPFLDVSRRIVSGGEQGLLGLAFAPDYAKTRRFYVHYTNRSGDTRIVEYKRSRKNPNRALGGTARVVLRQSQPESNHNGGQIAFGPDGFLYIGLGDGGAGDDPHGRRGNAQNLSTKLGKILRIDPRRKGKRPYRVPRSNPFVGRRGARPEVFAYGLRNPWRFSFDRETGDLTIGDVGQDAVEEIDFVSLKRARGANFGWRPWEGRKRNFDEPAPGHVPPVLELRHSDNFCSITGGYVVRDPGLPSLRGRYVYGDFCQGRIRSARLSAGGASGA
jgi:glucose/arabinose dehydrogenase